jgi:hypothetical protein
MKKQELIRFYLSSKIVLEKLRQAEQTGLVQQLVSRLNPESPDAVILR